MHFNSKPLLSLFLLILLQSAYCQVKAVTEEGDTIYVYANGTWSFDLLDEMPTPLSQLSYLDTKLEIDTVRSKYSFKASAKKQVSDTDMFIIKYDDEKWKRVPPATLNEEADFAFLSKSSDIWCIVIAEETPIPQDKLFLIAKNTMFEATGVEPEILRTELRTVNGTEVFRGVMKGNFSGIPLIFDSYYFSNDLGSVQFTTWTSDKVWERNQSMIIDLLNGFIVK